MPPAEGAGASALPPPAAPTEPAWGSGPVAGQRADTDDVAADAAEVTVVEPGPEPEPEREPSREAEAEYDAGDDQADDADHLRAGQGDELEDDGLEDDELVEPVPDIAAARATALAPEATWPLASSTTQPDDEYVAAPTVDDGLEPAATDRPAGSRLTLAAAIVVVLAVAGSVLLAVVAQRDGHRNAVDAARKAALAAARTETAATLSYDYRHLDADFATAERGLTPRFRASYARTTTSSVVPLARKTHAISTATVAAAAVVSAGADSATILIYADQTVQNNLLKATSRLDQSVIEVSMVKQGGRWLIDNLQPF
jgi:Mce-associated membrane protein